MAKLWNVRLKSDISQSQGLIRGFTIRVVTDADGYNYPDLRKALTDAGYDIGNIGGWEHDGFWDWIPA